MALASNPVKGYILRMKITEVLGARVLIMPIADETVTPGGIALPQNQVKRQPIGVVLMVGTGNGDPKLAAQMAEIKVGDRVQTDTNFGAIEVDVDGKACRIHSIMDVQAVIE